MLIYTFIVFIIKCVTDICSFWFIKKDILCAKYFLLYFLYVSICYGFSLILREEKEYRIFRLSIRCREQYAVIREKIAPFKNDNEN